MARRKGCFDMATLRVMDGIASGSPANRPAALRRLLRSAYPRRSWGRERGDKRRCVDFSGLAPAGPAARCRSPCAIHLSCGPNPGSSGTVLARDPAPHRAAICWRAIFGAPNDGGGPSFCKPIQILPELLPTDFGPPLLDGERTARARARVRIKEPGREKCRRQVGDLIRQQKPRLAGESPGYANTPA